MKEKMMKWGVLAMALVLAFVFAACAQPTDEAVGPGTPAIIRLYLDRPEGQTLKASAQIALRAGEQLLSTLGADETARRTAILPNVSAGAWNGSIPLTNLEDTIPEVGYFESGALSLIDATKADAATAAGGIPIVVTSNAQYYIDFELVNHTTNLLEKGSSLSESFSLYLELVVVDGTGGLATEVFYYTPEKTRFNDWDGTTWTTDNRNIQTVDIGPGINELYLSQFSNE